MTDRPPQPGQPASWGPPPAQPGQAPPSFEQTTAVSAGATTSTSTAKKSKTPARLGLAAVLAVAAGAATTGARWRGHHQFTGKGHQIEAHRA